jgi:hypothetical protein
MSPISYLIAGDTHVGALPGVGPAVLGQDIAPFEHLLAHLAGVALGGHNHHGRRGNRHRHPPELRFKTSKPPNNATFCFATHLCGPFTVTNTLKNPTLQPEFLVPCPP